MLRASVFVPEEERDVNIETPSAIHKVFFRTFLMQAAARPALE
jgi:hypothetical protein